ncbi:MAG: hypothetical protein CSA65_01210 [Proteobacteria bacterium]|nr:MAG: hypothetical protein CSB49_00150 [Pseudomonadota bacterium]PIE19708.1 MAG: hypothetical protein CSA65_01210 [Pseudomonadota bacterium]
MSGRRTLIAVLLTLGAAGLYGALLKRASAGGVDELSVVLLERRARLLVPSKRVRLAVDGRRQAQPQGVLPGEPGRHIARWSVRYLGRRPRILGHGYLVPGATQDPSGWLPAVATLTIAQAVLDGPGEGDVASALSAAAEALLRRELTKRSWIERAVVRLLLGALDEVSVHIAIVDGGLRLAVKVAFELSGERLELGSNAHVGLTATDNRIALRREGLETTIVKGAGGSWWRALRAGVGVKILEKTVPKRVEAAVDKLLPQAERLLAELLSHRLVVAALEPTLKIEMRPRALRCQARRSLALTLDLRVLTPSGRALPAAALKRSGAGGRPVAYRVGGATYRPFGRGGLDPPQGVSVTLHLDAVNAALSAYWASGALDAIGASGARQARHGIDPRLARLVAFEVTRTRLRAAPMVMPGHGDARLIIGPLRLSLRPIGDVRLPPAVDLHAALPARLDLAPSRQQLTLSIGPAPVASSCGEGTSASPLSSCFDDFLGLANRWLAAHEPFRVPLGPGPGWASWSVSVPGLGELVLRGSLESTRLVGAQIRFGGSFETRWSRRTTD